MAEPDHHTHEAELPSGTLAELFLRTVDRFGEKEALLAFKGEGNELESLSYSDALRTVQDVVGGLRAAGIDRGDRVAILSTSRPEWALTDYGCICAGVVDVPIYPTLLDDQVGHILADSGAKLVFAENAEQVTKVQEAAESEGLDLQMVVFEWQGEPPEGVRTWGSFIEEGRAEAEKTGEEGFRAGAALCRAEDVVTLIYTSGTTGVPKGVMLTHRNLFSNVEAAGRALKIDESDLTLSHLPLCHVFQRMVDFLLFSVGCTIVYAHDIRTVAADLKVVRPTLLVSVPRLYEKVYSAVMGAQGVKGLLVRWAERIGASWADETLAGRQPRLPLRWAHALADRLVFAKVRAGVGGKLRFFVSGSAPLEPTIASFFYAAGLPILEGYGLTETSPVTNLNTLEELRIGTVGKTVAGTEIRIAADGEILIRGPQVMKGYYNNPEATAANIDDEGWFQTGDIGEVDHDGYLRITDRKKDLIVTAGGKNVAPQPIENRLKTNVYVEQVVMVGDRRKFCSLLVVPAFEQLERWAKGKGLAFSDRRSLVALPQVQGHMEEQVLGGLSGLASYQKPKKLVLLTAEFSIEDGTLTPTDKIKRRVVQERFEKLLDQLYEAENADRAVFVF